MRRFRKQHLNVEDYHRSKALDVLADNAHAIGELVEDHHEATGDAMHWAYARMHKEARALFPLYPHEDYMLGVEFLRANGIPT